MIVEKILNSSINFEGDQWKSFSPEGKNYTFFSCSFSSLATDLMSKLLEKDPTKRIKPVEALHHPWIRDHITKPCDLIYPSADWGNENAYHDAMSKALIKCSISSSLKPVPNTVRPFKGEIKLNTLSTEQV